MFCYSISRPGKDGSPSSLTNWLQGFEYFRAQDMERNLLRTNAVEQAAADKHLFYNAERNAHIELKMPEYVTTILMGTSDVLLLRDRGNTGQQTTCPASLQI